MKTPSKQDTFDHVVLHCIVQGRQAVGEWGVCDYFAPDGSRCAVGSLIPPHMKEFIAEDEPLARVLQVLRSQAGLEYGPHSSLLADLQKAHDGPTPWRPPRGPCGWIPCSVPGWLEGFRIEASLLALEYGLDDSVCWFEAQ